MSSKVNSKIEDNRRVRELQKEVESLKDLVNSLLSVICEDPDGVHSGSAPSIAGQPRQGFCM